MFKVCLAFVGQLAKNYQQGYYDEHNEWASRLATEAYEHLVKEGLDVTDYHARLFVKNTRFIDKVYDVQGVPCYLQRIGC